MAKKSQSSLTKLASSLPGARRAPFPRRIEPALAEPVSTPPAGDQWLHEIKLDGYRMFCRKVAGTVKFVSRSQQDWTSKFGPLVKEAEKLKADNALLDGEVVVVLEDGRTSFQALQNAVGDPKSDKIVFYAFDLLHVNGYDLMAAKLEDRKELLQKLLTDSDLTRIRYSEHIAGRGLEVFQQAANMGVEGIVSKRRDHPYRQRRTSSWKKAKCIQSDDFVIAGYTTPTNAAHAIGAILVGQYDRDGRLVYAGRVGTGFSETTRKALKRELRSRAVDRSPFVFLPPDEGGKDVRYVEPTMVAHVEFLGRTGEHNLLRHAVFRGLREDMTAHEVARSENPPAATARPRKQVAESTPDMDNLPDIRFTHPDKLVYPEQGITKLDLARYYFQVAEFMLPLVRDRPLSLLRCPEGIDGARFFQKRPPPGLSSHVKQIEVPTSEGKKAGMAVRDVAGLLTLVQVYAVEIHPWCARTDRLDRPDRIVFDLDPDVAVPWQRVKDAALELRELLSGYRLESFLLATGGKGLHVVVPITRRATWDQVKAFSFGVAKTMAGRKPREFTANFSMAARRGKIYIDYLRNRRGATSIAPYSTRARPGAPVAVPVAWEELAILRSAAEYSVQNISRRLKHCPWEAMSDVRQELKSSD